MRRAIPDELVDDLRDAAKRKIADYGDDIPLRDILEWEAADFIAVVTELLVSLAQVGDERGKLALTLLAGDYPAKPDDGERPTRFD